MSRHFLTDLLSQRFQSMRTTLLFPVFVLATAANVNGQEASGPTVREKVNAVILESFPWSPPPKATTDQGSTEKDVGFEDAEFGPAVILDPMVVSRSKPIREIAEDLARKEQESREERYSVLDGGTIGRVGPLQLGGWGSPDGTWTFLRRHKTLTHRQFDRSNARLKALWDFKKHHQKHMKTLSESGQKRD